MVVALQHAPGVWVDADLDDFDGFNGDSDGPHAAMEEAT
jgi:hypothetical protein